MPAAIQPLLFARHREENNCRWKFQFAENAGTLQGDGGAAAVVIGAGRDADCIECVTIARIIVPCDEHDSF